MSQITNVQGLELRGKTYYLRMRVPAEYADVEPLREINRSLKTRNRAEAEARCSLAKLALKKDWEARKAGQQAAHRDAFEASVDLLHHWGLTFRPVQDLIEGPIDQLLTRIEKAAQAGVDSAAVPAALGALDVPDMEVSEMAKQMERIKAADIAAKNHRQFREWRNKYVRAAKVFSKTIGARTIRSISEQDATNYWGYWKKRRDKGEVTTLYATKQIRYMRQMVDAYFEDLRIPKSRRVNHFEGLKVDKIAFDIATYEARKLSFPAPWIVSTIFDETKMSGLNQEARDITIISADNGTRQSEVYDVPEDDIHLDHAIPHIMLRIVDSGPHKRQVKNMATCRPVVLLGRSLEAMCRNPQGFIRYRGKATYSGTVNAYFRENGLFPDRPAGSKRKFTIGGLRHTFEDRMIQAKMNNEERAYLMGHSLLKVRERPVYGADLDLRVRALYQEMVAFPTDSWNPRPISVLRAEIDRLAEEKGFRIE